MQVFNQSEKQTTPFFVKRLQIVPKTEVYLELCQTSQDQALCNNI